MGELDGRSALITGGSSGIGLATAQLFLEHGAAVTISGRDNERLEQALDELRPLGSVHSVAGDVAKMSDAQRMVDGAIDAHGGLDTLICNAGVGSPGGGILNLSEDEWDTIIDANLKGMYTVIRAAAPHMVERRQGWIVTIGSEAGLVGLWEIPAYCASKGGVINLTRSLALDLVRHGIRVNCLCPGLTETPINVEAAERSADPEATRQQQREWNPLGRMSTPREQAEAALFLVTDRCGFMVGSVLVPDGGFTAR